MWSAPVPSGCTRSTSIRTASARARTTTTMSVRWTTPYRSLKLGGHDRPANRRAGCPPVGTIDERGEKMTTHDRPFGRYYEDFEIGDIYKHWPGKTITEYDDHLFCMITMNHHPLHTNE